MSSATACAYICVVVTLLCRITRRTRSMPSPRRSSSVHSECRRVWGWNRLTIAAVRGEVRNRLAKGGAQPARRQA